MSREKIHIRYGALFLACALSGFGFAGIGVLSNVPSASASSGKSVSSEVAAAKKIAIAYETPPTKVPVTVPLKTAPPKGGTVVWAECDLPFCTALTAGLQQAVKAIGWKFKTVSVSIANPASYISGLTLALQYKPTVVLVASVPPDAGWSSVYPKYAAAHVPIVGMFVGNPKINKTYVANIGSDADLSTPAGKALGNWFIANSLGVGTAINQEIPGISGLQVFSDAFASTVSSGCSSCKVIPIVNSISDEAAGTITPAVVSAVRSNDADYVIASTGEAISGLPAALTAAGLSKVSIAGQDATPEVLTNMAHTSTGAWAAIDLTYASWAAIDVSLRYVEHMKYATDDGGYPQQLLVPGETYKSGPVGYVLPFNYVKAFKHLWHVK